LVEKIGTNRQRLSGEPEVYSDFWKRNRRFRPNLFAQFAIPRKPAVKVFPRRRPVDLRLRQPIVWRRHDVC